MTLKQAVMTITFLQWSLFFHRSHGNKENIPDYIRRCAQNRRRVHPSATPFNKSNQLSFEDDARI